jgi:hypothetical protein
MSNLFQEIKNDANEVQDRLLGPTYPYYNNIKTPKQIGMSSKGDMKTLGKNIDGLIDYVEVLVTGKSKASETGQPLGNKFFLKTGGKCKDTSSDASNNEQVDRYIYINNVPNGNIPFISAGLGTNFDDARGLIPGAMSNLNVLNPFNIMQAFMTGPNPECEAITMETIDTDNNKSTETHYVAKVDIRNMDPCSFSDKKNPVSNKKCRETYTTTNDNDNDISLPDDPLSQIYFISLSFVGLYIFYKVMQKSR